MLESRNFVDGVDFTRNDPCIFVVYPAGAAGDLLVSIIDKHYLRTGCEYYGIGDTGKVHLRSTDYDTIDQFRKYKFDDQWFYDLAEKLGERNLNYSLLDQVIFACHMYKDEQVESILDTFPNGKVIRILPFDNQASEIIDSLRSLKLQEKNTEDEPVFVVDRYHESLASVQESLIHMSSVKHKRLLDIPFGSIFSEQNYYKYYDKIIDFLNLNGRLICYDYIQYYLSKQQPDLRELLVEYSKKI